MRRKIIIADIHGCLDEYLELLKTLSYNKEKDEVILAGDLVDRGPDSIGVIRKTKELGIKSVIGNHERKLLNYFSTNNKIKKFIPDFYKDITPQDLDFINSFPNYYKLDNDSYVIHAGARPYIPIEKQKSNDLLYLRYVDSTGKFISIKKIINDGPTAHNAIFWTDLYDYNYNLIYGHFVHSFSNPKIIHKNDHYTIGLDNGACFGGKLNAYIFDTKEVVQVSAKEAYVPGFELTKE